MSILPTHKSGIEYLEHCAVRAADTQLVFVRRKDAVEQHFNIPNLNTTVLLLGPGTSLTQQAARLCAEGQILVGFCGGGATPVYLGALNEYREPEYARAWAALYHDEPRRLAAARLFQRKRGEQVLSGWARLPELKVLPDDEVAQYLETVALSTSTENLLLAEAAFSKQLYALLARNFGTTFTRKPRSADLANTLLDAGNYLAYGLAAACLWVLGISHAYPVMHGKTRRGALVFDLADVIKDAYIMPNAFISAALGETESQSRRRMLAELHDAQALKTLFTTVKAALAEH